MSDETLELKEYNRAQIILWLAQAAQITSSQGHYEEAKKIYEKMMEILSK